MSSVDDRIVNMKFNNKQFESGVSTSKRSLAGLEGAIGKTAKGQGMSRMASGVDAVKNKFGVMQVAGVAAVATIASKATAAGLSLVKSLTIDPILQGWNEYNTNLKSIQTVMANTGKGIKPVQAALQALNRYSDQTIYNFSEMARNVGTFSAAGVKLKTSVSAIKGIANIAALSGSSSQQASTAMYQLSQAIAAGRVNLQDWNSVVNAGMGGRNLQTALVQTGIAMGKVDEKTVKFGKTIKIAGDAFRQSISAKSGSGETWLTSDVLVKTLALMDGRLSRERMMKDMIEKNGKLASDQQLNTAQMTARANKELDKQQELLRKQGFSDEQIDSLTKMADNAYKSATVVKTLPQLLGVVKESIGSVWANAFTGIVGNFTQSKALWTATANSISDSVQNFSMGLNNIIWFWKNQGGRIAVIEGFKSGFEAIGKILKTVKMAFRDVFPADTESMLANISKSFRSLMDALVPSAPTLESLRKIFGGIFAVLHIGTSIVSAIFTGFKALFGALFEGSDKTSGGLLQLLGSVGELLMKFDEWLTKGGKLSDFMQNLGETIGTTLNPVVKIIGGIVSALGSLTTGGPTAFFESITSSLGGLSINGDKVKGVFESIGASLGKLDFSKLKNMFAGIDFNAAGDMAKKGVGIAVDVIRGIAQGLAQEGLPAIISAVSSLGSTIISAIKGVLGISSPATTMFPIGVNIVMGIAHGIAGAIKAIPDALAVIVPAIGEVLMDGLRALPGLISGAGQFVKDAFSQLFGGMDSLDFASVINALIAGGLMLALRNFTKSFAGIGDAVTGVLDQTKDSLKTFQNAVRAKMLMDIAIAVALLAGALLVLSFIPMDRLAKGLGAMAIMLGMITVALMVMNKIGQTVDKDGEIINKFNFNLIALGASMLLIATAMIALATAVAIFGSMSIEELIKGLGGMAIGLGILMGAMFLFTKFPKGAVEGFAASIIVMAIAMNILAAAVFAFGSMDLGTLAKGLGAIAIGLGLFVAALMILSAVPPGSLAGVATGMLAMATAMLIMSTAVVAFGNMDLATLAVGMTAMAIGLGIMVAALVILGANVGGTIVAAGAMLSMALAMAMLVPVIATLGNMDMSTLAKGLIALGIALALFVIAVGALGAIATVVGPGLLMLGGALALAGVGMLAFGTGFALMAAAGVAGVAVLSAAFAAIIALLPQFARQVAAALVSMIETFAQAAPRLRKATVTILRNMLAAVRQLTPDFGKTMLVMIMTGLNVLGKAVPRFVEVGLRIIESFLKSVAKHIPKMTQHAIDIVVKFISTLAKNMGRITEAGVNLILKFIEGLTRAINNNASRIGQAGLKLAMALINGLTGGLLNKGWSMVSGAVSRIVDQIKDRFQNALKIFSPSKVSMYWGEMIGKGLAVGLANTTKMAVDATVKMANASITAGNNALIAYQDNVRRAQAKADRTQATADATRFSATKILGNSKAAKKRRADIRKLADKQQKTADKYKKKAEAAQATLDKREEFEAADLHGKGDIRKLDSETSAATAARLLAKAAMENAAAKRLRNTNRAASIALIAKAKADAALARKYARDAQAQHKESLAFYAQEVDERIKTLEETRRLEEQAVADQAELDAADTQGKAEILKRRAEANEAKAEAAKADALRLIEEAKKLAATNAAEAMKLLDQSEKAAEEAKTAAEEAKKQRDEAAQVLGQSASGGGPIEPSRDILEQAASEIDRMTASLQAATELAESTPQPMQFIQNNHSPVALPVSEIYRQGKNLVAAAEIKLQNGS